LFTIAKRHILRCLREQERIESLENKLLDSFIVPQHQEEKALLKERKKILHAAFRKLPERKQKLLGLWLQEQKRKETAEEMEIKTKSVSVEKAVLIKMLQRIIRDDYAI
jgi:RNA polymerase sigma factor (sigma-70 family)